jgi:hypothetical protein
VMENTAAIQFGTQINLGEMLGCSHWARRWTRS